MNSLTFVLENKGSSVSPDATFFHNTGDSDLVWQRLATKIANERSLGPATPQVLKARWESGCAAILLHDGEIIGYQSTLEWVSPIILNGVSRPAIIPDSYSFQFSIIESCTGFIDPKFRRKGHSLRLREFVYEKCQRGSNILFGVSTTFGMPTLFTRLGWREVSLQHSRFLRSMIVAKKSDRDPVWGRSDVKENSDPNFLNSVRCFTNNDDFLAEIEDTFSIVETHHLNSFFDALKVRRKLLFGDLGWTYMLDPWSAEESRV
jgi:hypothetical protein